VKPAAVDDTFGRAHGVPNRVTNVTSTACRIFFENDGVRAVAAHLLTRVIRLFEFNVMDEGIGGSDWISLENT
jgi:hypothetical protein